MWWINNRTSPVLKESGNCTFKFEFIKIKNETADQSYIKSMTHNSVAHLYSYKYTFGPSSAVV